MFRVCFSLYSGVSAVRGQSSPNAVRLFLLCKHYTPFLQQMQGKSRPSVCAWASGRRNVASLSKPKRGWRADPGTVSCVLRCPTPANRCSFGLVPLADFARGYRNVREPSDVPGRFLGTPSRSNCPVNKGEYDWVGK